MNPFQFLTPEQLAMAAAAAFHQPQLPQTPGMSMPQQQQAGGMGMGEAMGMLGMGLGALNKPGTTPNGNPNDNRPALVNGIDPRLAIDPLTGLPRNMSLTAPNVGGSMLGPI